MVLYLMDKKYIDYLYEIIGYGDDKMASRLSVYQRVLLFYALQRWYFKNS